MLKNIKYRGVDFINCKSTNELFLDGNIKPRNASSHLIFQCLYLCIYLIVSWFSSVMIKPLWNGVSWGVPWHFSRMLSKYIQNLTNSLDRFYYTFVFESILSKSVKFYSLFVFSGTAQQFWHFSVITKCVCVCVSRKFVILPMGGAAPCRLRTAGKDSRGRFPPKWSWCSHIHKD